MKKDYNILVIDDTVAILIMLEVMLKRKGYKVTVKESPDNLEQLIDELSVDLIIMDVLLSGVDGRDICANVRNNKRFSPIPIIMISALLDAETSCLASGAQYFLSKPFEIVKFYKTVETALSIEN